MNQIEAECRSCAGTGLYCGFAEPKNHAVICHTCNGMGKEIIKYKPFIKRKHKDGVKFVMGDGGLWFARTGKEKTITIKEFYENY